MGRWRRHLDPSVKKDAWSGAEDDKLMRLHDTLGPRWSNISKMLTGRTAQQCRARWFQLSAADDDDTGAASDATADGAAVVTVTVGAAGDEASLSRKKAGGRAEKKTQSENMSPSTPSVTEEAGTVSAGTAAGVAAGASSRKRVDKLAEKKEPKRRKMLKDAFSAETGAEGATKPTKPGAADYYGHGGGLDMLAMLYSAAVTYEQGVAAVTGSAPSLPAELHA